MKFSQLVLQGIISGVFVAANDNESTLTITKTGESPQSTNVNGRFDHTTRVTTTTDWVNPSASATSATATNNGNDLTYNGGVAALIACGGLLLL